MADVKLEIKIGNISFSGEGDKVWLTQQLDKILKFADVTQDTDDSDSDGDGAVSSTKSTVTLSTFLKSKKAGSNQVKKFLATAVWLDLREGKTKKRTTTDVTKALDRNHQGSLSNASQSLNNNVTKGYCEKKDKAFYVTEEGRKSLGE